MGWPGFCSPARHKKYCIWILRGGELAQHRLAQQRVAVESRELRISMCHAAAAVACGPRVPPPRASPRGMSGHQPRKAWRSGQDAAPVTVCW